MSPSFPALSPTPQRRRADVSDAVDRKMRSGGAPGARQALATLSNPERVELITGWLRSSLVQMAFHRWTQSWTAEGIDGPGLLKALAEVGRPEDPEIADLLNWTAERVARTRKAGLDEPFASPVPAIWRGVWPRVTRFFDALVERWPEDIDPVALPVPTPPAAERGKRPARVDVGGITNADELVFATAWALYQSGAEEADLRRMLSAAEGAGEDLIEALSAHVTFEGLESASAKLKLTERLFPSSPMAKAAGLERIPEKAIVFAPEASADSLNEAAKIEGLMPIEVRPDRKLKDGIRAAARSDVGGLVVRAASLNPEDAALLCDTITQLGWVVFVAGEAPANRALKEEAARRGIQTLDAPARG